MNDAEWLPLYERIRRDFGYDRRADERARDLLATYATPFDLERLDVEGESVAIAGGAPTLADECEVAAEADHVFAASTATDVLRTVDVSVDLMVTDLDKNPGTAVRRSRGDRPVAVHAHGDNMSAIERYVPAMDAGAVLATTQVEPVDSVYDFGGFTDGDRAAFLADHLGADRLVFPGWDFDDRSVDAAKYQKLQWAKRLLAYLEERRDDHFEVLDGHHSGIDPL